MPTDCTVDPENPRVVADVQSLQARRDPIQMQRSNKQNRTRAKRGKKGQNTIRPPDSRQLNLNAPQAGSGIQTYFNVRPSGTSGGLIISGRDLTQESMSASSATPATVVVKQLIVGCADDATALVTRWRQYAQLFQRWRIHRLRAHLVSNMATTTVGNNYLAFDVTPDAVPSTAEGLMRLGRSVMGNAYSNISVDFNAATQIQRWFPCELSASDDYPGILCAATDGYSSALVPGKIVIDYEIEFCAPR